MSVPVRWMTSPHGGFLFCNRCRRAWNTGAWYHEERELRCPGQKDGSCDGDADERRPWEFMRGQFREYDLPSHPKPGQYFDLEWIA
jgi:hypothetical protein